MIVNFTLGLQSPIHMHFCSATQFIADLQCLLKEHLLILLFGGGHNKFVSLNDKTL